MYAFFLYPCRFLSVTVSLAALGLAPAVAFADVVGGGGGLLLSFRHLLVSLAILRGFRACFFFHGLGLCASKHSLTAAPSRSTRDTNVGATEA